VFKSDIYYYSQQNMGFLLIMVDIFRAEKYSAHRLILESDSDETISSDSESDLD
jgi:hypothetical protein